MSLHWPIRSVLMTYRSGSISYTQTQTASSQHTHMPISLSLLLFFTLSTRHVLAYTALTRADYYSVVIKSQFGVGRLSGHLTGHSTRKIVGCIEIDDAAKVAHAALVWKCAFKNLGVATNWNHLPLQNIDGRIHLFQMCPSICNLFEPVFCVCAAEYFFRWLEKHNGSCFPKSISV